MRRTLILALVIMLLSVPMSAATTWNNGSPLTRVVSRHYGADPVVVISIGQDTKDPLDVLVTLELASLSHTPALQIHKLRLQGAHWTAIMAQRGIQPQSLLAGVSPLPPSLARLAHQSEWYDGDVRELVGLRVVSSTLGESVSQVAAQHNAGASYIDLLLGRQ